MTTENKVMSASPPPTPPQQAEPEPAPVKPYSSFSKWEKRFVVFMASGAGLFSSLSAQIYFPALNTLAEDMNVTATLINLTVTSYMVSFPMAAWFVRRRKKKKKS